MLQLLEGVILLLGTELKASHLVSHGRQSLLSIVVLQLAANRLPRARHDISSLQHDKLALLEIDIVWCKHFDALYCASDLYFALIEKV